MKRCNTCKKKKPLSEFNRKASKKDGLQGVCRECNRKSSKKYYASNKQKHKAYIKSKKAELLDLVNDIKAKSKCLLCPEIHIATLDFHHRDPSTKEMEISKAVYAGWPKEKLLAEIEKCDVICSNCHRKLEWKKRQMQS